MVTWAWSLVITDPDAAPGTALTWPARPSRAARPSPLPTPRWRRSAPASGARPGSAASPATRSGRAGRPPGYVRQTAPGPRSVNWGPDICLMTWDFRPTWTASLSAVTFLKILLTEKHYFHPQISERLSIMRNTFNNALPGPRLPFSPQNLS